MAFFLFGNQGKKNSQKGKIAQKWASKHFTPTFATL
jgi:hypothetical protein